MLRLLMRHHNAFIALERAFYKSVEKAGKKTKLKKH